MSFNELSARGITSFFTSLTSRKVPFARNVNPLRRQSLRHKPFQYSRQVGNRPLTQTSITHQTVLVAPNTTLPSDT